jgi:predicted 3-demethylubiquinone-9 3-methyltransferase (glyoxalase superfamily)
VFNDSGIDHITYYGREGHEIHGQMEGTVLTVEFHINGQQFTALNGGPVFQFSEAVSFQVFCDTQEEIDSYWKQLSAVPEAEQCGWLKDKYGVSWQIVPVVLKELLSDPSRSERVTKAFLQMKKFDIDALLHA